jgi:hypothetical protein
MATNGYCDVQDLQDQLDISTGADDIQLDLAIGASSRAVDAWCGRRFYKDTTVSARYYPATSSHLVEPDDFWSSTGLVVQTDVGDVGTYDTTWVAGDYELHPVNGIAGGREGWPYTQVVAVGSGETFPMPGYHRNRVKVTARWGWSAVPEEVKLATVLKAVRLYRRKFSPDGSAGGFELPVVKISTREDPDVTALLAPFRKLSVLVV